MLNNFMQSYPSLHQDVKLCPKTLFYRLLSIEGKCEPQKGTRPWAMFTLGVLCAFRSS